VWLWIWTGLVAGWLIGAGFGLVWLWRQLASLIRAGGRAAELASSRLDPATNPAAAGFRPAPVPQVAIFATPEDLTNRMKAALERGAAKRRRRQDRHQRTYDAWARLGGYKN
jgi:hypothetical protein